MFKFPSTVSEQKFVQNFIAKIVQFGCYNGFPKSYKMLKSNYNWNCRFKYRFSLGKGKIRHLGSIPKDSGSRYTSPNFSFLAQRIFEL